MGFFIPKHLRGNIANYKYSGADHSIVSKYILTPYWNWLVTLFPLNVAPNAITLSGLSLVFINFATLAYFVPTLNPVPKPLHVSLGGPWEPLIPPSRLRELVPSFWEQLKSFLGREDYSHGPGLVHAPGSWLYFSWAIGLFLYQSLDAIDGKQARRTKSSGPLGEMFDHGCDALNTSLEVMLSAAALNLGQSWWTVASQVATLMNFYLTTWEEYHTHTLYLSVFSGPVEGILMIIAIFFISGIKGPQFWDQGILTFFGLRELPVIKDLGIKDLPLNESFMLFGATALLFNIASSYSNVVKARKSQKKSVITPLFGLLPITFQTVVHICWLAYASVLRRTHLIPFICFWGLAFAYMVGQLILNHVIQGPFPYWNVLMGWSVLGLLDASAEWATGGRVRGIQSTERGTVAFIWISLIFALGMYAWLVVDVIWDICDYADINCLTIKKKPTSPKPDTHALPVSASNVEHKEKEKTSRRRALS